MANKSKTVGKPFPKGQSGNPSGRPKGSRNKLGEDFIRALADDFEKHGESVIERVRDEKPDVYMKTIAAILPKDVNIKHGLSEELQHMTEEAIRERLSALYAELGRSAPAAPGVHSGSRTH